MKEEKMTFTVIADNGKEMECDVLFTFESDETKKNYIVYTDNTVDEQGNTRVYASIYEPVEKIDIKSIVTKEQFESMKYEVE